MIVNKGKYYLYRHIRLDKNEPFYIGIGTKRKKFYKTKESEYERAFSKNRTNNDIWNRIVAKTDFVVKIVLESDNYDFIKQKEIEFISLYGRKNLNNGYLSNLTDGGEGTSGHKYKFSEELKLKCQNHSSCKKVVKLDNNFNIIEIYKSTRDAGRKNNFSGVSYICINKCPIKNNVTYRFLLDYNNNKSEIKETKNRKIINYNNIVYTLHEFCKYVSSITKVHTSCIYNRLQNRNCTIEDVFLSKKEFLKKYYLLNKFKILNIVTKEEFYFKTMEDISLFIKKSYPTINLYIKTGDIINKNYIIFKLN